MNTFQKLLIVTLIILGAFSLFLFNQYLKSQEQIKKDEISLKEQQQKVSECKYLLTNKDLILEKEIKDLRFAQITKETSQNAPNPQYAQQYLDESLKEYVRVNREYEERSDDCRNLLRNLGL